MGGKQLPDFHSIHPIVLLLQSFFIRRRTNGIFRDIPPKATAGVAGGTNEDKSKTTRRDTPEFILDNDSISYSRDFCNYFL